MIMVNGKIINNANNCSSITINNGEIIIDGNNIDMTEFSDTQHIEVKINVQELGELNCSSATVYGNIINASTKALHIEGNIAGDVQCSTLSICGDIKGDVQATVINR